MTLTGVAWPRLPEPVKVTVTEPDNVGVVDPPQLVVNTPPVVKIPVKPAVELLEVALIVRPFGYLQVDDGPRSVDALARHVLKLPPGSHRFTVTCDLCETQGRSLTMDIKRGEEIPLVAPLKPSLVSFQGWPDDAKVRVGPIEKTVKESQAIPFRLSTPASGNPEMRHKVEYSVSVGGEVVDRGTQFAAPGRPLVIEKKAAP